ncbi:hypothetical protein DFH11DRAFT_1272722 [Phellopilus nigrolimitatus]|nr:hypothetical protein DFH11DRAFT_1272722 [Phellopilus nigrolimitatus]
MEMHKRSILCRLRDLSAIAPLPLLKLACPTIFLSCNRKRTYVEFQSNIEPAIAQVRAHTDAHHIHDREREDEVIITACQQHVETSVRKFARRGGMAMGWAWCESPARGLVIECSGRRMSAPPCSRAQRPMFLERRMRQRGILRQYLPARGQRVRRAARRLCFGLDSYHVRIGLPTSPRSILSRHLASSLSCVQLISRAVDEGRQTGLSTSAAFSLSRHLNRSVSLTMTAPNADGHPTCTCLGLLSVPKKRQMLACRLDASLRLSSNAAATPHSEEG